MDIGVKLQIAQICISGIQVFSLWVLVFCALRLWHKEWRMTEYDYHMLHIGVRRGHHFPPAVYRKAARYAARHDRTHSAMWQELLAERLAEVRASAKEAQKPDQ